MENYHFREFSPMSKSEWLDLATQADRGKDPHYANSLELASYFSLPSYYDQADVSARSLAAELEMNSDWQWFERWDQGELKSLEELRKLGVQGLIVDDENEPSLPVVGNDPSVSICYRGSNISAAKRLLVSANSNKAYYIGSNDKIKLADFSNVYSMAIDISGLSHYKDVVYEVVLALLHFDQITDRYKGQDLSKLWSKIFIVTDVSTRYFQEILKLRTLNQLLVSMIHKLGLEIDKLLPLNIYARLGSGMESMRVDQQLLRLPVAMLAAINGGSKAIEVDLKSNNKSKIHYRNISNILREEVHAGYVAGALNGSYFLESAVEDLSAEVWRHFQSVLNRGGLDWLQGDYKKYLKLIAV
ncbi:methylmalonyl-CoA mutase family protein [Reichenbachiella ulvae]|uniref:Methylmalonyl-CoA mutase family protein n=1 Tax=Reichenbachiella ulvae TaxID=2980104 RepID=A0ABT3CNY3_9BACT|nr:methylmalonyl-CoA mutase family protein [Reichenbachiella ulvae]MCV9385234.1 methylmalonyl-CoA mutase family protein [Reichenbachiella ulvae]